MRRALLPTALSVALVLWAAQARTARTVARAPAHGTASLLPATEGVVAMSASAPAEGSTVPPKPLVADALRGVVVDPDWNPIPDATVRVRFGGIGRGCFRMPVRCGELETATDACGAFAFAPPEQSLWAMVWTSAAGWVDADPRAVRIGEGTDIVRTPHEDAWDLVFTLRPVRRPGNCVEIPADAGAMGLVDRGNTWPCMRISLERGATIEGTVETRRGDAVPGALVTARWQDELPGWRTLRVHADADGRFSVLVPAPTLLTASEARVTKTGREIANDPRAWAWPVQPGTSGLRLVLEDLVAVDLSLRGAPAPVEKVWITAKPVGFPGPVEWLYGGRTLYTEPWGGALRAWRLLPGTLDLEADPDRPGCVSAFARATVPGGPVEITWPRTTVAEGLLDAEDVLGFEVTWTGEGRCEPSLPCRLCEDGRFRLVGSGAGTLYARRAGDPRCAFVDRLDPSSADLRLELRSGKMIRGRVEGEPGMKLSALRVRAVAGLLTQEAGVQDDGSFAIVGLPPLAFRVELRSCTWLHDARDDVPAGTVGVRLRVRLPATDPGDGS